MSTEHAPPLALADHRATLERFVYEQTRGAINVEAVAEETMARATRAIHPGDVDPWSESLWPWLRALADEVLREALSSPTVGASAPVDLGDPAEDPDAYVEALRACFGVHVHQYVLKMCANGHLSDDVTSETFERALKAARSNPVRHDAPMAWLRTIARNLLTDHYRRAVNRHEVAYYSPPEPEAAEPADAAVLRQESSQRLERALTSLTPGQRRAIEMRTIDGLSTSEVAARMGRSEQAVRSLVHKAMKTLTHFYSEPDIREDVGLATNL